jgi:hypothetical protein
VPRDQFEAMVESANPPKAIPARLPAHLYSCAGSSIMVRSLYLTLAFLTAAPLTAVFLAGFARYNLGMSRIAIRVDALSAAGLIFAAVAAVSLMRRKK